MKTQVRVTQVSMIDKLNINNPLEIKNHFKHSKCVFSALWLGYLEMLSVYSQMDDEFQNSQGFHVRFFGFLGFFSSILPCRTGLDSIVFKIVT